MIKTRIIPVITFKDGNAVQTVQFKNPRPIGSLQQVIAVFEKRNCDELVILDIGKGEEPKYGFLKPFLTQLFCPLSVGGNVRSVEAAQKLLRNGADKVIVKYRPDRQQLFEGISSKLGAQALVAAVDVQQGDCSADARVRARLSQQWGAGEILLTCINRQGRRDGYNCQLIEVVSKSVNIPVVAHGGAGQLSHMLEALQAGAHAVAAGTMFAFTEYTPKRCAEFLKRNEIQVRLETLV
jgi:imidazole glycerol-phosphate synthase subunit HisF